MANQQSPSALTLQSTPATLTGSPREALGEALHRRTAFCVHLHPGVRSGQMYVELLEPPNPTQRLPLILVHDDFQTGQIFLTKPDGNPGWASYFLHQGYSVYVPDLPHCGRSNYAAPDAAGKKTQVLPAEVIERELTATARSEVLGWTRANLHDKWPGSGLRNDSIFERLRASLTPMVPKKAERETLSQSGLTALLHRSGRALLVGVGSGAIAAWLAADREPSLVAAVVAVEPSGPPCGFAHRSSESGYRTYSPFISHAPGIRRYGVSDIPMTYNPPLGREGFALGVDVQFLPRLDGLGACARQIEMDRCAAGEFGVGGMMDGIQRMNRGRRVRKLVHLQRMRHAVVTSHAGLHITYDWATVNFLRDAGVDVQWVKLEELGILGNGHLMFLEVNSDQIAAEVHRVMEEMAGEHIVQAGGMLSPPGRMDQVFGPSRIGSEVAYVGEGSRSFAEFLHRTGFQAMSGMDCHMDEAAPRCADVVLRDGRTLFTGAAPVTGRMPNPLAGAVAGGEGLFAGTLDEQSQDNSQSYFDEAWDMIFADTAPLI